MASKATATEQRDVQFPQCIHASNSISCIMVRCFPNQLLEKRFNWIILEGVKPFPPNQVTILWRRPEGDFMTSPPLRPWR